MYHKKTKTKFKKKTALKVALTLGVIAAFSAGVYFYLSQDELVYDEVSFSSLKDWKSQDFTQLRTTALANCKQQSRYFRRLKHDDHFGTVAQWQNFCKQLEAIPADNTKAIRKQFEKLDLYHVHQPFEDTSLFTGYYSPLLHGSYEKTAEYNYPIYKRPDNLVEANLKDFFSDDKYRFRKIFAKVENGKIKPYYTRKQIEGGNGLTDEDVIVWVNDKVAAFFLHIQGSGEVKIDKTGEIIQVGYAGQNGHKYYAIGHYMAKKGMLEKDNVSLQSIRKYLEENPDEIDHILNQNPSYIFFTKRKDGPYGAFGNVLTKGYSVAVDRRYIPLGTPMFFETKVTATNEDFNKMVFAQDIGGAIKGAVRADIFFGSDDAAERNSGMQNQEGRMYVFSADKF